MESKIIRPSNYTTVSGYNNLCAALGRILGGMSVDGAKFVLDSTDFGLMCAQMMMSEVGLDLFVMGISHSIDKKHSYVAMSDGSIWRFESTTSGGMLVTEARQCVGDEADVNCAQVVATKEAIKTLAIRSLVSEGAIIEGDTYSGHVIADQHSAILMRPYGYGALIVTGSDGIDKGGWKFALDAPRNVNDEEAKHMIVFAPMSKEELIEERKRYAEASQQSVEGNPFPQKIGVA